MRFSLFIFHFSLSLLPLLSTFHFPLSTFSQTLHVGPGFPYARPEAALAAAHDGDRIEIHPLANNQPYTQVALLVRTPRLTITATTGQRIPFDGTGFDYSGAGSVPRAIIQFDPAATGCALDGFDLSGAHNSSHNGAGIRINQGNHVTVRNCAIHNNDMGVMSNGGPASGAADQRLERCLIYSNGDTSNPGFSHNLYLGGTSVVLSACEVHSSTSGHNVKSRAHYTRVEYSWIHDSANREFDLVDAAGDTDTPNSHALILGCIIHKSPSTSGNRGVIHFGQDGGNDHNGTLSVVNSTILTPYISPVVTLSAPNARLFLANSLLTDASSGQNNQVIVALGSGAGPTPLENRVTGAANAVTATFLDPLHLATRLTVPVQFASPATGDYRVTSPIQPLAGAGRTIPSLQLPLLPDERNNAFAFPLLRYLHPLQTTPRGDDDHPDLGAARVGP